MFASQHFQKRLWHVVPTLAMVSLLAAPRSSPKIAMNTIDPVATIVDCGDRIVVTGPISCDRVQPVELRVTITQRTTGAVAEGRVRLAGTLAVRQWVVEAEVRGDTEFEEGPATAVALAVSKVRGQPDDAHQWLVEVMLIEE